MAYSFSIRFFSFSAAFCSISSCFYFSRISRSFCFSYSLALRSASRSASRSNLSASFYCWSFSRSSYRSRSFYSRSASRWARSRRLSSSLILSSSFLAASAYSASSTSGRMRSVARALSSSMPLWEPKSAASSARISSVAYQPGLRSPSRFSLMMISLKTLSIDFLLHSGYLSLKSSMICCLDSREE